MCDNDLLLLINIRVFPKIIIKDEQFRTNQYNLRIHTKNRYKRRNNLEVVNQVELTRYIQEVVVVVCELKQNIFFSNVVEKGCCVFLRVP